MVIDHRGVKIVFFLVPACCVIKFSYYSHLAFEHSLCLKSQCQQIQAVIINGKEAVTLNWLDKIKESHDLLTPTLMESWVFGSPQDISGVWT